MDNVPFKGIIAYPVTPFDDNEVVDIPLFKKQVERLVAAGSHGIAPLGSTGVLPYLNDAEKEAIAEATMKQVSGRVPTLVGVSNLTTEKTIYHAQFAEKAGATAVMIIPMSYWIGPQDKSRARKMHGSIAAAYRGRQPEKHRLANEPLERRSPWTNQPQSIAASFLGRSASRSAGPASRGPA